MNNNCTLDCLDSEDGPFNIILQMKSRKMSEQRDAKHKGGITTNRTASHSGELEEASQSARYSCSDAS